MNATEAADFILNTFELGKPLRESGKSNFDNARLALIDKLKHHEVNGAVTMSSFVHIVSGNI